MMSLALLLGAAVAASDSPPLDAGAQVVVTAEAAWFSGSETPTPVASPGLLVSARVIEHKGGRVKLALPQEEGCVPSPESLRRLSLEPWVPVTQLATVITAPVRSRYADGTWVELAPGQPVAPLGERGVGDDEVMVRTLGQIDAKVSVPEHSLARAAEAAPHEPAGQRASLAPGARTALGPLQASGAVHRLRESDGTTRVDTRCLSFGVRWDQRGATSGTDAGVLAMLGMFEPVISLPAGLPLRWSDGELAGVLREELHKGSAERPGPAGLRCFNFVGGGELHLCVDADQVLPSDGPSVRDVFGTHGGSDVDRALDAILTPSGTPSESP